MLRAVRALSLTLGAAASVVLLGAILEPAAACPDAGVNCGPEVNGRTVAVRVTGSFVSGGSDGSSGGTTTVRVPVPCYLTRSWDGLSYYNGINEGTITGAGWDEWGGDPDMWPYPGWDQEPIKSDDKGHWYTPTCRMLDMFEDFEDFDDFSIGYMQTYPATFVEQGETPPVPPVPPEMLLLAAQEAMEVPEPAFEHNPEVVGAFDTLVNLDTWFWLTDPTQSGSVTATAGGNSVTVNADLTSVVFSAPDAGAVPCQGTGIAWVPGASSNCFLVFGHGGNFDVTADTQWGITWSYNGTPQGAVDPLSATFTDQVDVAEAQTIVTEVD